MPSQSWTLASDDATPVAVPISVADTDDPLAVFVSETESPRPVRGETVTRVEEPPRSEPEPEPAAAAAPWTRNRWTWIATAAAVIALIQAAFLLRGVVLGPAAAGEGRLRIASAEGAQVLIDGQIGGPAPFELPLAPGPHRVQVRYAGLVREFTADVRAGAESHHHVEFTGPAPSAAANVAATAGSAASLDITSDPPGARVTIDGRARGVTPLRIADLAPGEHDVLLAGAAGNVTRRVTLTPSERASLVITLPKAAPLAPGWLKVQSPVVAQIFRGTELLGTTEVDRLMLPAGRNTLRLVINSLGFERSEAVEITAGQTRTVSLALPTGRLNINATPWAQVWIDGKASGETPIGNLAIPIGPHEIVLRHPQFGEQRRAVIVTLGGVTRLGVDLRQ